MKIIKWIFACLVCLPLVSHAQVNEAVRALKVLPAPKEVRIAEGRMVIKPTTTILIGNAEDRTAAETLQKEIHDRTGMKLSIELVTAAPKTTGHISLGRLTDRGLRAYLESQGVQVDDDLGNHDLDKQGYVILVTDSGVLVAARTAQGLFYGVQTLRQLLQQDGRGATLAVPALVIRDWPSMEWRGVQDDISRGPILSLDYLKIQIRTLAEYKINLLGFNMENVFDFETQSLVSPKDAAPKEAAALTPAEIKELVDYAGKYYVTLLPEQQAFGHIHQFLKYEIYSDLAETPHGHVLTPANPKATISFGRFTARSLLYFLARSSTSGPTKPSNLGSDRRRLSRPSRVLAVSISNTCRKFSRSCSLITSNSCSGEISRSSIRNC
jgi:hypothetical protein